MAGLHAQPFHQHQNEIDHLRHSVVTDFNREIVAQALRVITNLYILNKRLRSNHTV